MPSLNSDALKTNPPDQPKANITPGDEREIVFDKNIGERKAGKTYIVDSSLAHHYCEVMKVARLVESEKKQDKEPVPDSPGDRAMKPPPRGKKAEG